MGGNPQNSNNPKPLATRLALSRVASTRHSHASTWHAQDSTRNYMTKFLTDDWMISNKFMKPKAVSTHAKNATPAWNLPTPSTKILG